VPDRWRWLILLNPMSMPVEGFRYVFLGTGIVTPLYLGVSIAMTLALLVSGLLLFQKVERTFVDTV
jgi:lipopolysaccharide transport system permease protein